MKKQLTIIFIFFFNISFLLKGSISNIFSSSNFDPIKEDLSDKHLSEKPSTPIEPGQIHRLFSPKFLCIEIEVIEDNYQKDRLEENQDSRIPLSHEDIAYSLEADHVVLPIKDNKNNLIPRYALCKIILSNNSKNQLSKPQEEAISNFETKSQDDNSTKSNNSFCSFSQNSSDTSSPTISSTQTNENINTSFSKNTTSFRRQSLVEFIERKGICK